MSGVNITAVDIGGTYTKMAVMTEDGSFLKEQKIATPRASKPVEMIKMIASEIKKLGKDISYNTCVIGVPGLINNKSGIVVNASNLKGWKNINLKGILSDEIKAEIFVENDANLIALGEMGFGAAKKFGNFIMLAMGTGLGGAIVLNGRLYKGSSGYAGEFGHFCVSKNGFKCSCKSRGCLETYVSALGINNLYKKYSKKSGKPASSLLRDEIFIEPAELFNSYKNGDILAEKIFHKMGEILGSFISGIANGFNIDAVVLTGGVSNSYEAFINPLLREIKKRAFPEVAQNLSILKGTLGDRAALLGSLLLIKIKNFADDFS